MKRLLALNLGALLLVGLLTHLAPAQGVLIVIDPLHPTPLPRPIVRPRPTPPMSYRIKEVGLHARVVDQVARVQVSQTFVNTGSRQMEVCFVFPLPYDGAVDRMTFMVDGKEYQAQLLAADKARSIYEGYIRRNQDPALLEWIGTGMFKTSVFPVPPGAERKVSLRYNQMLRKDHGLTDFLFPLKTAQYTSQAVEKVDIQVAIESSSEIKNVYSPTHPIEIKRPDKHRANISYVGKDTVPTGDFRLFYDAAQGELNASVISYRPDPDEDGYFLLLASPRIEAATDERPSKNVVFVVDRSGSMSGKKIEQVREALKFVLNNLREGDHFNIVAYDSGVEAFQPELQPFTDESRKQALGFAAGLYAGGATNIDGALERALSMLDNNERPNFVIFLTDGQPTAGETNEMKIVANTHNYNDHRARVISFGVGYDVNSRLLDRLSRDNFGQSEYVRPDEDIETHVGQLYSKISSPVMTEVSVKIEVDELNIEEGPPINRTYPGDVHDLFQGEQLVMAGRYRQPGAAKVVISGRVGDRDESFEFGAELAKHSADESFAFVEKLWAMRRIGTIIDELDLNGSNEELISELVTLSTQHGILTQYTSYLADDTASIQELAAARAGERGALAKSVRALRQLDEAGGVSGFAQRAEKSRLRNAELPSNSAPSRSIDGQALDRASAAGGENYFFDADDSLVVADAVQSVGKETLYRRGNVWIAANAAEEDLEQAERDKKVQRIKRFSDEYFILVAANSLSENQLLSRQQTGEELIVKLRGQLYRIE